ncbi:NADPH-dependent FMN reductase [Candidatus Epulonipiscium fishelsonii]|uniref:NADPH-dependent FMN reductase n=1 Tax=Candidatus Epulonipiscium fishelsonii TaxID=77094 RepID=A0ACC8XFT6_9FIRM|nr:NADPH-dependent FMN reductase [Epulopiscium sp. SCG-B11WGA-EpuloA1]ONI42529.1 NADPH-dependent FMN reductase [Epulopiscium sp. SCG-B05WGA-EpuloA1]ONI47575.1 NADPH-dependent FMN reductase [Epulopiscium sp. SCG-C06WGA-EpuloA1]
MKVLLVNGSPNKSNTTCTALSEVEKSLNASGIETEVFWLGNKAICECIGCMACRKLGKCFMDDKVNEFVAKATDFDGFIFGTPVHYAAASGSITSFMDRVFFSGGSKLAYKPAACVIAARRAGTTATFDQINKYFTINNMPVVSSNYWNAVHGLNAEETQQDKEGLQTMRILGQNMAWLLKCIEMGKQNGLHHPEMQEREFTNFVH